MLWPFPPHKKATLDVSEAKTTSDERAGDRAGGQRLIVNGSPHVVVAQTLADLIAELGYGTQRVATARNGEFVAERLRADTRIENDDRIEIVAPRQGG
jgi:sulfur carrier protein